MLTDNALKLELHRSGKVELLELQTDRALVGSGAHCDVRLLPDEAAVEQLEIETHDEEIFVKVRSFEPPCLLNGAPFLETRLSPDALIELGKVALRVRLVAMTQAQRLSAKQSAQTHPLMQGLGLVGLAFGFYFVLHRAPERDSALAYAAAPPRLFQGPAPACPHEDQAAARALADEALRDAANKRERSPFYPRDGLLAVPAYERAAACYERVGEAGLAREARANAATLKARARDELHVRHVRIERLIAQEKYDELRREVWLAAELIDDKSHPYAAWLSALGRETELRGERARGR